MRIARMPTGTGLTPLADIPDGQCRDGFSEPMIRREYSVVAMPMLPRRWDESGQAGPVTALVAE